MEPTEAESGTVIAGAGGGGDEEMLVKGHKVPLYRMNTVWQFNVQHGGYR